MNVFNERETFGGMGGGFSSNGLVDFFADESCFGCTGTRDLGTRASDCDASRATDAIVTNGYNRRTARDRVVRSLVFELHIRGASTCGGNGEANFGEEFARFECCCEGIDEEIIGGNGAFAVCALCDNFGIECKDDCRHIASRVRVCDAATKCAAIANLLIADDRGGVGQEGEVRA